MKHVTLTLLAILASVAGANAQTSTTLSLPLSLNDAIALGLEHNRTVANASMQVDKAEQDIAVARSRRLPSFKIEAQGSQLLRPINLTFARGAFGEFPGIGPVPGNDTDITTPARLNFVVTAEAQQPLTQLIKLHLNVRLNEATREYERERVRDARLGLVDEIRRLYYSIAQTRSALDASDHTLTMLRELDRLVTVRMAQQVALKGDGLTVQSRIAQTELTRLSLAHGLASQKEQLNQMIGRDLRTPFDVVDIPDATIEEVDLEVAQSRAIEARPDIRQARNLVHETEERAVLDINSRFRKLEEARAQVRAARIGQDSARENARVKITQYEVQAALLSDLLQTQATMADSNSQYQQALTAFWSARADFARALGEEVR